MRISFLISPTFSVKKKLYSIGTIGLDVKPQIVFPIMLLSSYVILSKSLNISWSQFLYL